MKLCSSCKHWIRESHFSREIDGPDDPHGQQYPANYGYCDRISGEMRVARTIPTQIDKAVVKPGEGSYLLTYEDFGCVLHEEEA